MSKLRFSSTTNILNTHLTFRRHQQRGSRVVEHRAFGRSDRGSKPPKPFRSLGNFIHPTLPVSFSKDSKSLWSLLSGVYARGSKISHAGKRKKLVVDSLTLEKDTRKTRRTTLEVNVSGQSHCLAETGRHTQSTYSAQSQSTDTEGQHIHWHGHCSIDKG